MILPIGTVHFNIEFYYETTSLALGDLLSSGKKTMEELIEELRKLKEKAKEGGGPERVKRQKEKGKLTVWERLEKLLDPGSFVELQPFVVHRSTYFGLDKVKYLGDGVVVGYGKIDGRLVHVFAQDFTVIGGSLGEMHAKKIESIISMALKTGTPLIGLYDSGGARIHEGVAALDGFGRIFRMNVKASGIIPQISLILGPCAGGASYSPALTDFIIMPRNISFMFITGPQVVKAVTGEEVSFMELGGAEVHASKSGVAHFITDSEEEAFTIVKKLLSYIPSNNMEDPPYVKTEDPPDREDKELETIVPTDPMAPYDVRDIILRVVDDGEFLEVHENYAPNVVVGFARLNGYSVGVVANQPRFLAGALDIDGSIKAARFVRFCDSFNIPIIMFVDVPGYLPGVDQEHGGIIKHGAKLVYAYAEATVPKITVILRKAYGGAYIAMGSKSLGADLVFAWPTAEIAVMGPEGAVRIIFKKELAKAENPEELFKQKLKEYRAIFANPYRAAELGLIDDVIEPSKTRPMLIKALEALQNKREEYPLRKHGNMPL